MQEIYIPDKKAVIFCASVRHSEEMAELFREQGFRAFSISGSIDANERKRILSQYENGDINVLCKCDLLDECRDCPHTQVLFMAFPTMSRTIYMLQLGRSMRKSEGNDFLMVFDCVDNANMYSTAYSLHRMFGINTHRLGELVIAPGPESCVIMACLSKMKS